MTYSLDDIARRLDDATSALEKIADALIRIAELAEEELEAEKPSDESPPGDSDTHQA